MLKATVNCSKHAISTKHEARVLMMLYNFQENEDLPINRYKYLKTRVMASFALNSDATIYRAGKNNFLPGSTTWRQKCPADQRSIFVLNLHVHKHIVFWLTMVLNSRNNVCQPYVVSRIVGHGC